MIQKYFILTDSQRSEVEAFNSEEAQIAPRAVDGSSPGVALNLNDNATGYDPGDPVPLSGKFLAPKRIVDDPVYLASVPDMVTYLLDKPFGLCEDETVFLPPPPPPGI